MVASVFSADHCPAVDCVAINERCERSSEGSENDPVNHFPEERAVGPHDKTR